MSRTNEAQKKACSLVIDGDKLKGVPKGTISLSGTAILNPPT